MSKTILAEQVRCKKCGRKCIAGWNAVYRNKWLCDKCAGVKRDKSGCIIHATNGR